MSLSLTGSCWPGTTLHQRCLLAGERSLRLAVLLWRSWLDPNLIKIVLVVACMQSEMQIFCSLGQRWCWSSFHYSQFSRERFASGVEELRGRSEGPLKYSCQRDAPHAYCSLAGNLMPGFDCWQQSFNVKMSGFSPAWWCTPRKAAAVALTMRRHCVLVTPPLPVFPYGLCPPSGHSVAPRSHLS